MTVFTSLAALQTVLQTTVVPEPPSPQGTLLVYPKPAEQTLQGNFPAIFLGLSPTDNNQWVEEALGLMRHNYWIMLWLFLGARTQKLPELHDRLVGSESDEGWPEAITRVLSADITLGGVVHHIGENDGSELWSYKARPIQWGSGTYYGIVGRIQVTEKVHMTMG